MKFSLERIRDADIEPITADELKAELRAMVGIEEDSRFERLISSGRQWFEDHTGLALIDQTWRLCIGDNLRTRAWGPGDLARPYDYSYGDIGRIDQTIMLRRSPVLSVLGIVSLDATGTQTIVAADTYQLRDARSKWPNVIGLSSLVGAHEEIQITFRAGYADRTGSPTQGAEVVPPKLLQPIYLWAEAMYDKDKEMMSKLLTAAENLADKYSVNLKFA